MSYDVGDRVKIRGTNNTGMILNKKGLVKSLFGILPRYQISINVDNRFTETSDNYTDYYRGGELEHAVSMSEAEKLFNKIKEE